MRQGGTEGWQGHADGVSGELGGFLYPSLIIQEGNIEFTWLGGEGEEIMNRIYSGGSREENKYGYGAEYGWCIDYERNGWDSELHMNLELGVSGVEWSGVE